VPYVDDPFANWNKPVAAPAVDPFANWNQPDQTVLWAGRPVTKSAVDRAAAARGVSPDTIMELGTPAGRFEAAFAQSAVGQTVLRAGEGIKQISETVTANLARAAGRGDIAARIHNDRNQRNEFLSFAEQGGDLSSVLGERANRIYNQTTQSLGNVGATAVLTGPVGVYSMMAADAWESGLDEAQRAGLAGVASIGHAARKATIEGGVTFLMGRIPGVASLEESFSPAMRNAAAKQLEKAGVSGLLQKLGGEAGGIAAEAAEEVFIAGGQQLNEMSAGLRKEFDWSDILDAGLSGAAARGAVGTSVKLNNALRGIEKSLPDVSKGTRSAEIDVERGITRSKFASWTARNWTNKPGGHSPARPSETATVTLLTFTLTRLARTVKPAPWTNWKRTPRHSPKNAPSRKLGKPQRRNQKVVPANRLSRPSP